MQGSITVTPLPSTARASALGGLPPFAGFLPFGTCCLPALRRLSPLHGLPVLRGLPALRGLSDILPFTCSLPLAGFGPSRARCPCSQILLSFSSNLLLFLQFPSSFRAGFLRFLSLSSGLFFVSKSQISFERFAQFALCFQTNRFSSKSLTLQFLSRFFGLFRVFSSRFRAVCSFCSNPPVSFERFVACVLKISGPLRAVCYLFSRSLGFEWFAPGSRFA